MANKLPAEALPVEEFKYNKMSLDQTNRPLSIPVEYGNYAEEHAVYDKMKRMMTALLLEKPNDPLQFLLEHLDLENDDAPRLTILGPPVSGKYSIAEMISKRIRAPHLTRASLIKPAKEDTAELKEAKTALQEFVDANKMIPAAMMARVAALRTKMFDCKRKGWVMSGFPTNRAEALAMQSVGVFPKHTVVLKLTENAALERAPGKRIDPDTCDVYHTTFDWPTDSALLFNLVEPPNYTEEDIRCRFLDYHRNIEGITRCYRKTVKAVNADIPKADVYTSVIGFMCEHARTEAAHTPRIVLIGPKGSGKSYQAAKLSARYKIVNVHCGTLLRQELAANTAIGSSVKTYVEKGSPVPDALLLGVLRRRLTQLDAQSRGWIVHGYPRTVSQAQQIEAAGLVPNKVIFMDIAVDSCVERLVHRRLDPVTGRYYHLIFNPPRDEYAASRLEKDPKDDELAIRHAYSRHQMMGEELEEHYAPVSTHINADQDPLAVYESIESIIVRPRPVKLT